MMYDPRFFRDAYGTGENLLSMITGAAAEPASGIAALVAAAQGYGARGARDAVRERMTYPPKSAAGIEQANALSRLMQGIVESKPVKTWQRGVDIAGRYSPAAGAALQTVPTAIGVAAGYKPAMAQGRAASYLAELAQKKMAQNAMAPRTLHPQAGVIDLSSTRPGQLVKDKYGDTYEFIGQSQSSPGKAEVIPQAMAKKITDPEKRRSYLYTVDPDILDVYGKNSIQSTKTKELIDLYHGSGFYDKDFLDVVDDPLSGGFNYGAVFASPSESASLSHGGKLYKTSIAKNDVLYGDSAAYNISDRKIRAALKDVVGKLDKESMDLAYEAIVLDKDIGDDALRRIFGDGYLDHEYGLAQQAARAKFAGKLGYKAVSTNDEHGISYMILPGHRLERVRK